MLQRVDSGSGVGVLMIVVSPAGDHARDFRANKRARKSCNLQRRANSFAPRRVATPRENVEMAR